mmetsp:Transcript_25214/g.63912  ORF Transcript_25214/g.63912 Transcript_25214/m.63912 type:complete len:203 (-) Transcript_25214:45-653(-)
MVAILVELNVERVEVDQTVALAQLHPPRNVQNFEFKRHGLKGRVPVPKPGALASKRQGLHRLLRLVSPLQHQVEHQQARRVGPAHRVRHGEVDQLLAEALCLLELYAEQADESVRGAEVHRAKVGAEGKVLELLVGAEEDPVPGDGVVALPLLDLHDLFLVADAHKVELVGDDGKLLADDPLLQGRGSQRVRRGPGVRHGRE